MSLYGCEAGGDTAGDCQTGAEAPKQNERAKGMTPTTERIKRAIDELREAGISDCVLCFEAMDETQNIAPYVIRVGSPMACLALAEFAGDYLRELRDGSIHHHIEEDEDD